jgi:transposase
MQESSPKKEYRSIPTEINEEEFNKFILPYLTLPKRGPKCKIGYRAVFNFIIWVLYTGAQWKMIPIEKDENGKSIIHYTQIYRNFARWSDDGSLEQAFIASVKYLLDEKKLDLSVLHGDGTNTIAKKGGDFIGYSGHKHQTGEKIIAIIDNNGYVIAPMAAAPVNESDMVLLHPTFKYLKIVLLALGLTIAGAIFNLDAGFDSKRNRRLVYRFGMKPNIKENPRNRIHAKRGAKRFFDSEIYKLRFRMERTFAWEDKFRRILIRFEFIHQRHMAFHFIAFTLINLRDFCGS